MGLAARLNAAAGFPRVLGSRLVGLNVAVDVQHLYKPKPHQFDRGTRFVLANGTGIFEAQAATVYASSLVAWSRARGARVLTNDPNNRDHLPQLVGSYPSRNREADKWGADVYLACHVNAGSGHYARTEYLAGTGGARLGYRIDMALTGEFQELAGHSEVALSPGQRGCVCIGAFPRTKRAVLLEPFFGDQPRHWPLFSPPELVHLGETIGAGIADWFDAGQP